MSAFGQGGLPLDAVIRLGHLAATHGFSTRLGGLSAAPYASLNLGPKSGDEVAVVRANRGRFLATLGVAERTLLGPRQVHSAVVAVHRAGDAAPAGGVYEGDGVVSNDPGAVLMVLAADCAAVLLHDPVRRVVGAVHSGWRGAAGAIAAVAVRAMGEAFGSRPADVVAGIGPAIGRCCYEVGPEVVAAVAAVTPLTLAALADPLPAGKARLDLTAAVVAQLEAAGVPRGQIRSAEFCTACRTDLFYSHRREGEPTGRAGAAIALP